MCLRIEAHEVRVIASAYTNLVGYSPLPTLYTREECEGGSWSDPARKAVVYE
jgi:hypothetical protein